MQADDDVVSAVFKSHGIRQPAELRGVNGDTAVRLYDQTVCEMIKRHNHLQHKTRSYEEKLASLETQLAQMQKEKESAASTPVKDSVEAQKLRVLENRLEKAITKCNETTHISKTYQFVVQKFEEERLHFDNQIAALEKAIKQRQKDLKDLQSMCNDAQMARDIAKAELVRQEELNVQLRKEREKELTGYKKQAEEKKEFAERVERRLNRMSLSNQEETAVVGAQGPTEEEDQEAKITSYEEALMKIKDTTGVASIQEVVERFLSQGATRQHLESLKEENTRQIARLTEEKNKLQAHFEEMKYSGEAKMSSGQRMLEEFQSHLEEAKQKTQESEAQAEKAARLLGALGAGVEHLAEKLQHIKAPQTHTLKPKLDPTSSEYVLDLLSTCEQKLVLLAEDLSSHDLETVQKEMEDDEFRSKVETHIPADNIRIQLPKDASQSTMFRDDSDSGSDEEFVSREKMKMTAQALVEAKTKKKPSDDDDAAPKKRR